MESTTPLRQSASVSSRLSAIDVSQLDKINAIPNKTTNNVLMDGLCQEDQLYLDALMDEESADSDEDTPTMTDHGGSPWSPPMAGRPMMNSKRIKRIKPAYTITLSLEDISYIRPSWGISKGIKRIELNKNRRKKQPKNALGKSKTALGKQTDTETMSGSADQQLDQKEEKNSLLNTYHVSLAILVLILISMMVLSYFVDIRRKHEKMHRFRLDFASKEKSFKIMKIVDGVLLENKGFKVKYGRGIPKNLKHTDCACEMYQAETRRYQTEALNDGHDVDFEDANKGGDCFACFDWSHRANLQVLVNSSTLANFSDEKKLHQPNVLVLENEDQSVTCYDIKWQSYDTLRTPLVDCFSINEGDQWFGMGDIQTSIWPLNKFNPLEPTTILSNLSSEFEITSRTSVRASLASLNDSTPEVNTAQRFTEALSFGSHAELQLLTSSGFFVGNLRTDFRPSIKISAERREICLSVHCSDRCTRTWSKTDDLNTFRYRNNLLEYSICSASSLKVLVSSLIVERTRRSLMAPAMLSARQVVEREARPREQSSSSLERPEAEVASSNLAAQQEPKSQSGGAQDQTLAPSSAPPKRQQDGLGLVERTIFTTSAEFIELLDGQTLRQHVDKIVKLNLKTSPILVLDTRWQLYLGSFRISSAYFPKAKLLFEILHNKGFKLVLTVKPYIDASIGLASLNQLMELGRLVTNTQRHHNHHLSESNIVSNNYSPELSSATQHSFIFRRQSFFRYKNETILIPKRDHGTQTPRLFKCKESHDGHCVLVDLTSEQNRLWLVELIKRSNFLTQEVDGILLGGAHPDPGEWDGGHRNATAQLIDRLFYREGLFVVPQWTGNFNYIQLAPRRRDWNALRSTVNSVLTLSMLGFSLVHPGSVWGDLPAEPTKRVGDAEVVATGPALLNAESDEEQRLADEELAVRWLQAAVFLPVLQFNDLGPIDRFNLHDQVQNLVKVRKMFIVPEIKRNLPPTPLLPNLSNAGLKAASSNTLQPAYRHTWSNVALSGEGSSKNGASQAGQQQQELPAAEAVGQQFMIGTDILVAPVLIAGQRQKDIYLPAGIWHDELRQTNVRGGKWLRNYPIELNEVAWFTRARR